MLKSSKSKNLNKDCDDYLENVRRIINTEKEKELDREKQIKDNTNGIKFKYLFATRFKKLCDQKFIVTGKQANDKLGIGPSTFSKYKTGAKFPSSFDELIRIAEELNVSPDYLLGVTDSTSSLPPNMNMELGLSEKARICLYTLYHYIQDDVLDTEIDLPHFEMTIKMLENFSLFIENFSDFCEFLAYITRYVEVKQKINELEENKENVFDYLGTRENLDDQLIRN